MTAKEKAAAFSRKWRKEHPKYYMDYLKKYNKKWREKRKLGLCTRCGKRKARSNRASCRSCSQWKDSNGLPFNVTFKSLSLSQRKLAITALLDKFRCCAICGRKSAGGRGEFHVDHNHKTKKFRGLLCHRCNLGLGQFLDRILLLKKAIEYLEVRQ